VLTLTKQQEQQKQQDQQQGQNQLDQPVIKVCGRKPQAEKPPLPQVLQQLITATPGYEGSSEAELAVISEGLLEFASIAYSIFEKEFQLKEEETEFDDDSSLGEPKRFKVASNEPNKRIGKPTKSHKNL
jgi:hypothetical protein